MAAAKPFAGQKIVYYGGNPDAGALEATATAQFTKDTGIQVTFTQRPNDSTESLALFQRFFQGQSPDIDAMSIDVVWPGILAQHLIDLSVARTADDDRGISQALQGRHQHQSICVWQHEIQDDEVRSYARQ